MHKAILAVAAVNLGLMALSRVQLPVLATATNQQQSIAPATPSPTATAAPSSSQPEPLPSPSTAPQPSPTPVAQVAWVSYVVNCQNFAGANFRTVPSLDEAAIVDVIPPNASVVLTGGSIRADGEVWLEVEWNGQRGWVAQILLSAPQQTTIQAQPATVPVPQLPVQLPPLPEKARAKAIEVRL